VQLLSSEGKIFDGVDQRRAASSAHDDPILLVLRKARQRRTACESSLWQFRSTKQIAVVDTSSDESQRPSLKTAPFSAVSYFCEAIFCALVLGRSSLAAAYRSWVRCLSCLTCGSGATRRLLERFGELDFLFQKHLFWEQARRRDYRGIKPQRHEACAKNRALLVRSAKCSFRIGLSRTVTTTSAHCWASSPRRMPSHQQWHPRYSLANG